MARGEGFRDSLSVSPGPSSITLAVLSVDTVAKTRPLAEASHDRMEAW